MKRINRCNKVVKLLSAARCCAKAIVDVRAVEFRFSAVEFVEKLLFDEADKKVSITGSHFSAHSDSVNLLVIVIRERKQLSVRTSSARRISVTVQGCLLARCQEPFVVGDNCI